MVQRSSSLAFGSRTCDQWVSTGKLSESNSTAKFDVFLGQYPRRHLLFDLGASIFKGTNKTFRWPNVSSAWCFKKPVGSPVRNVSQSSWLRVISQDTLKFRAHPLQSAYGLKKVHSISPRMTLHRPHSVTETIEFYICINQRAVAFWWVPPADASLFLTVTTRPIKLISERRTSGVWWVL